MATSICDALLPSDDEKVQEIAINDANVYDDNCIITYIIININVI